MATFYLKAGQFGCTAATKKPTMFTICGPKDLDFQSKLRESSCGGGEKCRAFNKKIAI